MSTLDYQLVHTPNRDGYSTSIQRRPFRLRTFLHMLLERMFYDFPCACCNYRYSPNSEQITTCQNCQAPICHSCTNFMLEYDIAKNKRCRWCGIPIYPPVTIGFVGPYFTELSSTQQYFYYLGEWFLRIIQNDSEFDFSKIIWQNYFERRGWRFYIDANWFFTQKLPNEYNIVMASMSFHRLKRFKRQYSKNFHPFFERFNADPAIFMFFKSSQIVFMHSLAVMMMKNMENRFFFHVLKRIEAKFEEKLSDGLGVNIKFTTRPSDDDLMYY